MMSKETVGVITCEATIYSCNTEKRRYRYYRLYVMDTILVIVLGKTNIISVDQELNVKELLKSMQADRPLLVSQYHELREIVSSALLADRTVLSKRKYSYIVVPPKRLLLKRS